MYNTFYCPYVNVKENLNRQIVVLNTCVAQICGWSWKTIYIFLQSQMFGSSDAGEGTTWKLWIIDYVAKLLKLWFARRGEPEETVVNTGWVCEVWFEVDFSRRVFRIALLSIDRDEEKVNQQNCTRYWVKNCIVAHTKIFGDSQFPYKFLPEI